MLFEHIGMEVLLVSFSANILIVALVAMGVTLAA